MSGTGHQPGGEVGTWQKHKKQLSAGEAEHPRCILHCAQWTKYASLEWTKVYVRDLPISERLLEWLVPSQAGTLQQTLLGVSVHALASLESMCIQTSGSSADSHECMELCQWPPGKHPLQGSLLSPWSSHLSAQSQQASHPAPLHQPRPLDL